MLIVGTEQQRIRLRSDVVKQVSPVLEGKISLIQGIDDEANISRPWCEVHLVDDNADAFKIFCSLAYGRWLPEYYYITASHLFDLALLVVKYKCRDRLFYGIGDYFLCLSSANLSSEDTWKVYAAAYLLKRSFEFQEYGYELIANHKGSYLPFAKLIPGAFLGARLCCKLILLSFCNDILGWLTTT